MKTIATCEDCGSTDTKNHHCNDCGSDEIGYPKTTSTKVIQLQRQGVSDTLKGYLTPDGRSPKKYYYLEIGGYRGGFLFCTCDFYNGRNRENAKLFEAQDLVALKKKVLKYLNEKVGCNVEFSDFTEGYCFPFGLDRSRVKEWADLQAGDCYLTLVVYEPETDTIRHAIYNYCLVSFHDNDVDKPEFNIDAATSERYDDVVQDVMFKGSQWIHDCDRKNGQLYCKGRLAWLISEEIKERFPDETPVKTPSIIQGHTRRKYNQGLKKTTFEEEK